VRKGPPLALVAGFALILFSAAVVLVGVYVYLPSSLEERAAQGIEDQLGLESTPEVEFERGSPLGMLAGRYPDGQVTMEGVEFGGVRAGRIDVDLDPLDLNLPASLLRGTIESQKPPSGTLRAEVSEEEISHLAQAQANVPVRDVELDEGRVTVRSEVSVLGFDVPVSVRGSLALQGGALVFEPRRASALGAPVPKQLREQLLAGADFAYPLAGLPYGAEITGAEVAEDRLVLSGEMGRILMNQPIG
jgi:hypothetical protein